MYYGEEKYKQMARSILPSTSRKKSRWEKKSYKRKNRRYINEVLAGYSSTVDYGTERYLDSNDNLLAYPDIAIRYAVLDRRAADKINHFIRWAIVITREQPIENRLSYMRALLPDGLIGEHALSHLKFLREFEVKHETSRSYRWFFDRDDFREQRLAKRTDMIEKILWLMHYGYHADINRAIKSYWFPPVSAWRPIDSLPVLSIIVSDVDVEALVDTLMTSRSYDALVHQLLQLYDIHH